MSNNQNLQVLKEKEKERKEKERKTKQLMSLLSQNRTDTATSPLQPVRANGSVLFAIHVRPLRAWVGVNLKVAGGVRRLLLCRSWDAAEQAMQRRVRQLLAQVHHQHRRVVLRPRPRNAANVVEQGERLLFKSFTWLRQHRFVKEQRANPRLANLRAERQRQAGEERRRL